MRRFLVLSLLFLAAPGVFAAVASADEFEGRYPVGLYANCQPTNNEGPAIAERCEVSVFDELSTDLVAPTGTVAVDHELTCDLVPAEERQSRCAYSVTAPKGLEFIIELDYLGDATHLPDEQVEKWPHAPGDNSWAGPPPVVPAPLAFAHYLVEPTHGPSASTPRPAAGKSRPRIARKPARRTHGHLAKFKFSGGTRFECKLDHGAFRLCGPTFSRHVSTGKHVLHVRPAGASGPVVTFHWRVLPKGRY